MADYKKLDEAIVQAVKASPRINYTLLQGRVRIEAAEAQAAVGGEAWRIIDRRLQALRKRKVIRYVRPTKDGVLQAGWVFSEATE